MRFSWSRGSSTSRTFRQPGYARVGQMVRFASIATKLDEHTKALKDSCAPNEVEFLGVGTVYVSALPSFVPCAS